VVKIFEYGNWLSKRFYITLLLIVWRLGEVSYTHFRTTSFTFPQNPTCNTEGYKRKRNLEQNAYAVRSKNRTQIGPFSFVLVCFGRVFDCVCAPNQVIIKVNKLKSLTLVYYFWGFSISRGTQWLGGFWG